MWQNVYLSIDWRPVCVHAIWTGLLTVEKLQGSAGALHGFAASPIAFISHERKQVVIHS